MRPWRAACPSTSTPQTTRDEKRAWNLGTATDGVLLAHDVQRVIVDMILRGVFDRFPELQIVSVENETGWAAAMIERADFVWRRSRGLSHHSDIVCEDEPSKYLNDNVHITFVRDRAAVQTDNLLGPDVLTWATSSPTTSVLGRIPERS